MGWVTGIVVYVIIWWLVIFMVLPWGVRRTETPEAGHDHGAPARPMLARKLLATTLIAGVLFAIVFAIVEADIISLREIAERMGHR